MKKSKSLSKKNFLPKNPLKTCFPKLPLPLNINHQKQKSINDSNNYKKKLMLTVTSESVTNFKGNMSSKLMTNYNLRNSEKKLIKDLKIKKKRNKSYTNFNCIDTSLSRCSSSDSCDVYNLEKRNIIDSNVRMHLLKKNEFASVFIEKTKEIYKTKIAIGLKKERYLQLKEKKSNEIDAKKEQIESINTSKNLIDSALNLKFSEFVKHLNYLVKEESKELEKIREIKNQRQKDLLILDNLISERTIELSILEKWFYFQLEIKYNKQFKEIESSISKEEINKYKNELIFESAEEFLGQFKSYELDIINSIRKYNRIRREITELTNQRELLSIEEEKPTNTLMHEIKANEVLLQELKKKNEELIKEKKEKIEEYKIKSKQWLTHKNLKLSSLICQLYFILIDHFKKNTKYNRVNFFYNYENEIIAILDYIENIINEIIFDIHNFDKGENNIYMINAIKVVERNKIIKRANQQRLEEENKFNMLKEKIERNKNKILFLPFKKVDHYYFNNVVRNKKINTNKKDTT